MADEISSGGTKNPHPDSTTAMSDPTVDTAPTSDERPSKRLKTAAHEARSESNGAADTTAVAENVATVSAPVSAPAAETQASADDTTATQAEPTNGGGEDSSADKAANGGETAVDSRRPGIAPIKPEYVYSMVLLPVYPLINGYARQILD